MMVGAFVAIVLLTVLGYKIAVNCLNYEKSELRDKLVKYGLVFVFLVYPTISLRVLEVLDCRDIFDKYYKVADVRTQCYTSSWTEDAIIAIIVIAVFVIGVPLAVFFTLNRNRHKLFDREDNEENVYYIPKIKLRR